MEQLTIKKEKAIEILSKNKIQLDDDYENMPFKTVLLNSFNIDANSEAYLCCVLAKTLYGKEIPITTSSACQFYIKHLDFYYLREYLSDALDVVTSLRVIAEYQDYDESTQCFIF